MTLPAFILGIIILTYWARVARLAMKARKRSGRAGNFLPPEPLGRVLRIIWIPVVIIWIVHPFLTAALTHPPTLIRPILHEPWLAWPAVLIAALALAGSLICWKRMGRSWRMGIDPAEKTDLVITGPFAYVRHPIYALSSLLMLATIAAIPSPLMIAAGLVHLLLLQWEARREELLARSMEIAVRARQARQGS
jgi:protein-S-isoprenylcysteine O-methyltransferase Ste14